MAGERDERRRGLPTEDVAVSSLLRGLRAARTEPPASPAKAPRIPGPGDRIAGKYVVESVLGAGGMGVVLAARHAQLGHRVAIKFIQGKAARDKNAVGRFLREARAAAALSSEHVAKVHDVGTLESGEPYSVMEYLSGVDLKHLLRTTGPLGVADAVGAVLQACEAVGEAHAMGIVHRDLKPSNLFVTQRIDGTPLVKVLDFGISKVSDLNALGTDQSLTPSGSVVGSPRYMSPEQVRNAREVDARSDIWSLGVILYELLTGAPPFAGETLGATLAKILAETPVPVRARRADVPEALAAVIARCLERDVNARVRNVGELAAALLPFASGDATIAGERILRAQRASSGSRGSGAPSVSGGASAPSASGGAIAASARAGKGHTLRMPVVAGGPPVAAPESADAVAIAPTQPAASPVAGGGARPGEPGVHAGETGAPWLAPGAQRARRAGMARALAVGVAVTLLLAGTATTIAMRGRARVTAPAAASARASNASEGEPRSGTPTASPPTERANVAPPEPDPTGVAVGEAADAGARAASAPAYTGSLAVPAPGMNVPATRGTSRPVPPPSPPAATEPGDPFGPMRSK